MMAKWWLGLLVGGWLVWAVPGQGTVPETSQRLPFQSQPVALDGVLVEWGDALHIVLREERQAWKHPKSGQWGGIEDLSADLRASYDGAHFYIAGRIKDNSLVRERGGWHTGDAIELFFDLDPADEGPGFDEDDFQLFLMPLNPRQSYGINTFPGSLRGGASLNGVRVVHKETADGWLFEARIPWHNLPPMMRRAPARIGFNVAIDDRDEGSDRYQYMTWNGENPVDSADGNTSKLVSLSLAGARPLVAAAAPGSDLEDLLEIASYFALPLSIVAALALILWVWAAASRRISGLHLIGRIGGVVLLVVGLLLPDWLIDQRIADREEQLDDVTTMLAADVPKMASGTLGGYGGGQRDIPLMDLLSGRALARQVSLNYEYLLDVAKDGFDLGSRIYPVENFAVLPYGIPLPLDQTEQFDFARPLAGDHLNIVVSMPIDRDFTEIPEFELAWRGTDEAQGSKRLSLDGAFELDTLTGDPQREVIFEVFELPAAVVSISLTALVGEGMELVGMTLIPESGDEGQPQTLGVSSLGGVETDLRGAHPTDAGLRLPPGTNRRVLVDPEHAAGFEKAWLFYHAEYPGADSGTLTPGEKVSEVSIQFASGKPAPLTVTLEHQESMFFELAQENRESEPPDENASVAYQWQDEDKEQHLTLVYSLDLPVGAVVESLEFKNFGPYAVRFRSVVFGVLQATPAVDPEDSPLEPAGSARMVRLKSDHIERVRGAGFAIYRSGSLAASTLTDAEVADHQNLPRNIDRGGSAIPHRVVPSADGQARTYEAYLSLGSGGWGDATLGIFLRDDGYGEHANWVHRVALGCLLLASPLLLLLFGEILAIFKNLRLRLIAVLSVATLVPLALLSVFLVRVLERGHEDKLQQGLQQDMAAANGRLEDEQDKLRESASSWLDTLSEEVANFGTDLDVLARLDDLKSSLSATMKSQLPPDWEGGFLRLEFVPEGNSPLPAFQVQESHGVSGLPAMETVLRPDPGVYVAWGAPFIGVRREGMSPHGTCSLSVARPLDEGLLAGFSPSRGVVLCDVRGGYPLGAAGGPTIAQLSLESSSREPRLMLSRRLAFEQALGVNTPVVTRHRFAGMDWIAAYDVLRDLDDTPRAIIGLIDLDAPARLELSFGAVPVRGFFVGAAALLVLLSVFLSLVVTARITKPIEQLERGAQALRRGELDVRVDIEEGGQIGRLTRAFNSMAEDLRGRIQDLDHLNRGIQELTSGLDLEETLGRAVGFCTRHSSADQVRFLLVDQDKIEIYEDTEIEIDPEARDVAALMSAVGPFSMKLALGDGRALHRAFPRSNSIVVLPLRVAGRYQGSMVLCFTTEEPAEINLELLSTMAVQTAVALQNARLYRLAVEDFYTGAYVPDYFRRRVVEEVDRAQERGEPLALLGMLLTDGALLAQALGARRFESIMEGMVRAMRGEIPASGLICRATEHGFQVLLFGAAAAGAEDMLDRLVAAVGRADLELPPTMARLVLQTGMVIFPEEAASAEFLFHALETKLAERSPAAPIQETVERLHGEGVIIASPVMQGVLRTLERVAPTDLTVLLEGETGTGKEVLTDLIHRWSKRGKGPLVKVHCAALSESLLQSELFGHEKGAFTGAVARKIGKFELAQGGTVFLDEVGEISLEVQVKLLRVLQEHEVDRVGGLDPIPVDVRVIAATNRNILDMVEDGTFREDLYYRLQGMVVTVPPLRERKEEIPQLVERFREEAVAAGNTRVKGFSADAMDELFLRDWPGNVRELRNMVFRAMVLAGGDLVQRTELMGQFPAARSDTGVETPRRDVVPMPLEVPEPIDAIPPDSGSARPSAADDDSAPIDAIAPKELQGRLRLAFNLIRQRGSLSTPEYVQLAGVSPRTGLRDMNDLVATGLIRRTGKRRGARYRLDEPAKL